MHEVGIGHFGGVAPAARATGGPDLKSRGIPERTVALRPSRGDFGFGGGGGLICAAAPL